jgi:hypothetical protein
MLDAEWLESRLVKGNRSIDVLNGYEDMVEHKFLILLRIAGCAGDAQRFEGLLRTQAVRISDRRQLPPCVRPKT